MSDEMPNEIELGYFYAPAPMSEHYYSVIDDDTKAEPKERARYIKAPTNNGGDEQEAIDQLDHIFYYECPFWVSIFAEPQISDKNMHTIKSALSHKKASSYLIKQLQKRVTELTDSHDMLNDEFQRISVCPNVTGEIKGLCERAKMDIKRRVPMIDENETLRKKVSQQAAEIEQKNKQIELLQTRIKKLETALNHKSGDKGRTF